MHLRPILERDNPFIAKIIRDALLEFGAAHPGTVYFDKTTDDLYNLFQHPDSFYFVAEFDGSVVGGGGIFPTSGLPDDTCELVKMYLNKDYRGKGIGRMLIKQCIATAKEAGFKKIYLETMPELKLALNVYEKFGFSYLSNPLGNSGHFGCDLWMIKEL
jgi:putative acetyltransferase